MEVDRTSDTVSATCSSVSGDGLLQNFESTVQSAVVYKFINGEITFNDYLNEVEDIPEQEVSAESKRVNKHDDTAAGAGGFDDLGELSEEHSGVESENEELNAKNKSKKTGGKKRSQRSKLSATLRAMMGQANVCYAKGDTQTAVKICLEIIKEEPNASEPLKTLASIYEEMGEQSKSLQMRLIAAHIGPTNKDEWVELAQILRKNDQSRQAVVCLTRAINLDVLNLSLYEERAAILKEFGIGGVDGYGYLRLLHKLDPEKDGKTLMYLCEKVARSYYNEKKYEKASNTLKLAFDSCSELITNAEINLYLDLLITTKNFNECLQVLIKFCNVDLEKKVVGADAVVKKCAVPENLPPDIREKLILTLIHFNSFDVARTQTDVLLGEDPNVMGDLFFDVAVALIEKERYEDALKLLVPLTRSDSFNCVELWFKLAHCYKRLNKIDECHNSYQKALEYFPDDDEIKLHFCNELKNAKLYREAIEITLLKNNNISLLIYERCKLYLMLQEYDNFIESGLQLFRLHYKEVNTAEDYTLLYSTLRISKRLKAAPSNVDTTVSLEEEWDIFLKICDLYIERKDYDLLQRLTLSLYLSAKFAPKKKDLWAAMIRACILNNDFELGFELSRALITREFANPNRIWNIFSLATLRAEYNRVHKFLLRLLLRNPHEDNAVMLFANSSLFAGTYKYALNDYTLLYEKHKTPLLALLIALNMLHIACQKYTTSKHALVAQMIAFLTKYQELRGSEASQEVFYNIGRAFHQIELLPQAIFYYKKALECKPPLEGDIFDLKCDIAFNLHLIYLNSGQPFIANSYLQKYIVI